MIVKQILVVFLVAYSTHRVECLECYSCTDVAHVSECNTITQCPRGNVCQASFRSNKYTLGCIDLDLCSSMNTSSSNFSGGSMPIIGRSISPSVQDTCSECCNTGNCNRQLCQIHSNHCDDSGTIDCSVVGSIVNICADKDHARTVCKRFCGLCEVDGNWSPWSEWTVCSRSCGNGTETRSRSCSDPAPANGGNDCIGTSHEMRACLGSPCPVNGGWNSWSEWGGCSVSCGVGIQRRDRACSSPYPSLGGSPCFGDSGDDKVCLPGACQDGGWSAWGGWESCSRTCDGGIQKRSRTCDNPSPSLLGKTCSGDTAETQQCALNACSDGNWSAWGSWVSCSNTCGGGIQTRSRSCTNPAPSALGHSCTGDALQVQQCSRNACPDEKIGFYVKGPATGSHSDRIRFTSVITNVDSVYSTTTGEITCKVPGMYFFSLTIISSYNLPSPGYARCVIYKNSSSLQYVITEPYHTSSTRYYSATGTVYIHLTAGDIVSLRDCTPAATMDGESEFSGYLVKAD